MNAQGEAFWHTWERARRAELRKQGLSRADAKISARFERDRRIKGRNLIGDQAAADADLILDVRSDGSFGASLKVAESMVPAELMPRARAWAGRASPRCH